MLTHSQIWKAIEVEKEKNARERDREETKRRSKKGGGPKLQVDQHGHRDSGSLDNLQGQTVSSGTQNENKVIKPIRIGILLNIF